MTTPDAAGNPSTEYSVDIAGIMEVLPHRYPFLMIDKLIKIRVGESAIGIKNVTINEPFFQGHFPQKPVMPGVLIIEAMAQTSAAFVAHSEKLEMDGKVVFFMSIDRARFRKPVTPGDCLELHCSLVQTRGPVRKFHGEAIVDGQICAEADFAAMTVDAK